MSYRASSHLPARPSFQGQPEAGPSRPPPKRDLPPNQAAHSAKPVPSYSYHSPYYPGQSSAYPAYPSPIPAYQSGGYQPQVSYPGYSAYPGVAPSYGQSLFNQAQTSATGGYASTYPAPQIQNSQPPAKRPKIDERLPAIPTVEASWVGAWRNCSQPGCKFTGPGEDVAIHEGDRHLIFPNGRPVERSEEEERYAGHKGPPPPVPGTNITLQTEEDIAKWIAERKARWPSSKRVAEKEEENRGAIARGEQPSRGRGRGRGRGGASGTRRSDPAALAEDWGREEPELQAGDTRSERGRERGRGRGSRGERGRGRGKDRGRGGRSNDQATAGIQDAGWKQASQDSDQPEKGAVQATPDIAALAVLGDYETSSESDSSDSDADSDSSSTTSDDSSDSDEMSRHDDADMDAASPPAKSPTELAPPAITASKKRPCKFYAMNGKCKNGDACRFAHTPKDPAIEGIDPEPTSQTETKAQHQSERRKPARQPQAKIANPFQRPSMLGSLLSTPIQNTLSQLSQTIRFLVANDMLKDVELKVGEAEERERERKKIVMLDDAPSNDRPVEGQDVNMSSVELAGPSGTAPVQDGAV